MRSGIAALSACQPPLDKFLQDQAYLLNNDQYRRQQHDVFCDSMRHACSCSSNSDTCAKRWVGLRCRACSAQGLVVRGRGDTDTLDDHKLLWAREGPVHDDIEARNDVRFFMPHTQSLACFCRHSHREIGTDDTIQITRCLSVCVHPPHPLLWRQRVQADTLISHGTAKSSPWAAC